MLISKLINRIRLIREKKEPYLFWKELLGYEPKELTLYEQALTHRSASRNSNERLEYLGDAVIGLTVAKVLYELYPKADEGFLTRARAKVVCREHLNRVCHELGIDKRLTTGSPVKRNTENIYGNAYEALAGAIYIEAGFGRAEAFVRRTLAGKESVLRHLVEKESDFKSRLLEWGPSRQKSIVFEQTEERYDSREDKHVFVYRVLVDGIEAAQAAGHSKREAQQTAARKALRAAR